MADVMPIEDMDDEPGASGDGIETAAALEIIRRGLRTTPELYDGIRVTALVGLAHAVGRLAIPIVIQLAIDRGGLTTGDVKIDTVVLLGSIGIVVVLGSEVLGVIAKRRLISRAEAALKRLRMLAFDHVHRLSLADHNEQATGILVSRVTSDVDALTRFADWGMFTWMVDPVVIVGVFIAMAIYSWQLALLALVTFLPAFFVMRWVRHRMIAAHDAKRTAVGDLLGAYSETLTGAEVIRAYNAEDRMQERLDVVSEQRYRAGLRANIYMSGVFVVGDLIGAFMMASVLVVGVTQRDALGLSAGELVALLAFTTLLHSPVAELGETINNAQEAVAGWRKVLNLLDRKIEPLDPQTGLSAPEGALSISAEGVGFAYRGGDLVLRDVNVEVPAGVRVAVVGETGSGKSTFARLLCRLADPTDGRLLLGGVPLTEMSSDARHRAVRLVPQDGFLFDTTIRRNIGYGRDGATDAEIEQAIDVLGLRSWVEGLPEGLDTPIGERGGLLSVGERQLVSFARAAVADPGLLILDEATSSVDPQTDIALTRAIDRLSEGRTVLSIAHRMSTAEAADLILVFDDGELVEHGPHADLVKTGGRYSAMHAAWSSGSRLT